MGGHRERVAGGTIATGTCYDDNRQELVIAEVPLLFESGYNERVDYIVLLSCSEVTLIERLKKKGFALEKYF